MNNLVKIAHLLWTFWQISKAEKDTGDLTSLSTNLQTFYSSPSIIVVYDQRSYGFEKEKILLEIIKDYSRQDRLSQVITFNDLNEESKRRENALYVLYIDDEKNLEHAVNVTERTETSFHPWLLISDVSSFNCDAPGEDFFQLRMDSKFIAKCKGDNVLKRYYSVFDHQTEVADLATWTSDRKLKFKDRKSLINAEMDMKGITLKIANRTSDMKGNRIFIIDKFSTDLIEELKPICNFKTEQGPQEDLLGSYDSTIKEWNGLIGIINKGMADIASVLFSMSSERMEVVDFITPLIKSRSHLYAKIPDYPQVNWDGYFQVFNKNTRIMIYLSIFMFSVVLCLMTRRINIRYFFENLMNIWGICTQQGLADQSSRNSIQTVYLSILLWSLTLQLIYSACFTSYVTVLAPKLPFDTYDEFKRDNTYGVSVTRGSSDYDLIMSSNDKVLSPLKPRLKNNYLLPKSSYEGFLQACREKIAFYSDDTFFEALKQFIPCQLGSVKMRKYEYTTFALAKNSPYDKTLSYTILRLTDFGILKRLVNKYSRKVTEIPKPQFDPVSLTDVYPILTIWALGLLIALLGLSLEIVILRLSVSTRSRHFVLAQKIKSAIKW